MLTYFAAMAGVTVFVGLSTRIEPGLDADGWTRGTIRFLILCAAAGCAVTTWGAAVVMASVYRLVWPLALATSLVVAVAIAFMATH
jgi:hypothetical protein